MQMRNLLIASTATFFLASGAHSESPVKLGIGRTATEAEIAGWNIDVDRKGTNLPPGKGSVGLGREVFDQQCAACHGSKGEGGVGDKLVGGQGTLATPNPVKTVGSYWPYATTLFDYIRRAMPHPSPQSLSNEEVYAVTAYVLHLNGLLPDNAALDAKNLPAIRMPNRDNFIGDPRPDVK
ncbi:c-type cytochrome [Bradyrhizobium sp. CCGUVB23]|uniref:c-type cytochrome n=1 Tax=Bradyrhizobium sp. CCGUVB23 TaxID=2949630 RepID=UPI0020B199FE|nr:cytochrome c [Bradyrhizobium sp. CCGUVB23]MCP3463223.1 cytochrome c [Bradyrhizobium sp. CCGUVB23]